MTQFDIPEFSTRTAGVHKYKVRYIVEVYADDRSTKAGNSAVS